MADQKISTEDAFRESLKDVVAFAQKVSSCCKTVEDLIGMAELALTNDGQLQLLMEKITTPQSKPR